MTTSVLPFTWKLKAGSFLSDSSMRPSSPSSHSPWGQLRMRMERSSSRTALWVRTDSSSHPWAGTR